MYTAQGGFGMSSDPSRPSIQCFPNLGAEKRVMANAIGNRSITVSTQGHPLCVDERQDREGGEKERERDEYHHLSAMSPDCSQAEERM